MRANSTNTLLILSAYLEHLKLHPWDCPRLQELFGNGCDVIPVDDDAAIRPRLKKSLHVLLDGLGAQTLVVDKNEWGR